MYSSTSTVFSIVTDRDRFYDYLHSWQLSVSLWGISKDVSDATTEDVPGICTINGTNWQ